MSSHCIINIKLFLLVVSANQHAFRSKGGEKEEKISVYHLCRLKGKNKMVKCERLLLINQTHPSGSHRITSFDHYLLYNGLLALPCSLITLLSLYFQFHSVEWWIIRKVVHDATSMFKGHIRTGIYCCGVAFDALFGLIQKLRPKKTLILSKIQNPNGNL